MVRLRSTSLSSPQLGKHFVIYIYIGVSSYHNLQLYPLRYARVFAYGCDCFYMVNRLADTGETREPEKAPKYKNPFALA